MAQKPDITLTSFGFKHGAPPKANIMMDVRFLKNPFWEEELKALNGQDKAIGDYIDQDPNFAEFMGNFKRLIEPLLAHYEDGLTIAIGCTGGHHRSVYAVEKLAQWLRALNCTITIDHRDLKM